MIYSKTISNSVIDTITVIYSIKNNTTTINEIILSDEDNSSIEKSIKKYGSLEEKDNEIINSLVNKLNKYFNGEDVKFSFDYLNFDNLTDFQKKVLLEAYNIEKGTTKTYREVAIAIDRPKAYRAVGHALSINPYPIIIPCHRVIKQDKSIGGFGGIGTGLKYKSNLLSLEGNLITNKKLVSNSKLTSYNKNNQTKLM